MTIFASLLILTAPLTTPPVQTGGDEVAAPRTALQYRHTPVLIGTEPETPPPALGMLQDAAPAPGFGSKGSARFNIMGGYAVNTKNSNDQHLIAGVEWSNFLEENLSLELGLNAIYFDQAVGPEAIGGNFTLLLRWHFYAEDTWSMYFDGGAGLLWTSEDVPTGGTSFNFTPQGGFGATFDIGDDRRLMTGVRWHHVSNANIDDSNPGRDAIQAYVGVSLPY